MKKINVLSVFNGMGCIWYALDRAGIQVNKRYSSEIDKYANIANNAAYPDTIQLNDINKWREWDIDWSGIDLFVGGSPCQGFSFAGKMLNFNDPRSKLFFVFVEIWNHIKKHNPDAKFLLENVNMKKEYLRVISEYLGIFPVRINSNLVSAQNRDRWYWSNIMTKESGLFNELWTDIPQPEDKGILLKDILQDKNEVDEKYTVKSRKRYEYITDECRLDKKYTQISGNGKSITLMAKTYQTWNGDYVFKENLDIRQLTPRECGRLQTFTDKELDVILNCGVSDTQLYKMFGNGWTIEAISHQLKFLNHGNSTK